MSEVGKGEISSFVPKERSVLLSAPVIRIIPLEAGISLAAMVQGQFSSTLVTSASPDLQRDRQTEQQLTEIRRLIANKRRGQDVGQTVSELVAKEAALLDQYSVPVTTTKVVEAKLQHLDQLASGFRFDQRAQLQEDEDRFAQEDATQIPSQDQRRGLTLSVGPDNELLLFELSQQTTPLDVALAFVLGVSSKKPSLTATPVLCLKVAKILRDSDPFQGIIKKSAGGFLGIGARRSIDETVLRAKVGEIMQEAENCIQEAKTGVYL